MLDRELLKKIITLFPDEFIVLIYKEKKINNFGFRAGNVEDVKKNRQNLERNLFKRQNLMFLENYLKGKIDKSIIIPVGITKDNVREVLDSNELIKLLIYLLVENRRTEFEIVWENEIGLLKKEKDLIIVPKKSSKILSNSESTKITKKLIGKIENLENRIRSRELQFKTKFEELNEKYEMRLRERNALLVENGKLKTKLKDESNIVEKLNSKLEKIVSERNENITTLQKENDKINNEIITLKKIMGKNSIDEKKYYILIVGEIESSNIENIHIDCMKFSDFSVSYNELTGKNYNEIWIINYDLTRKEKDVLAIILKDKLITQHIVNIYHWNELKLNLLKLETEVAIL